MDERMAEIGERIRSARRKKKLSQTNFGKIVGRSMNGMAMIERGEADPPVGLLMRIAEALDEDFGFLVTGEHVKQVTQLRDEALNILSRTEDLSVRMDADNAYLKNLGIALDDLKVRQDELRAAQKALEKQS